MRRHVICLAAVCAAAVSANAYIIDDFSSGLDSWTSTVILDNDHDNVWNTAAWQIADGTLQLNTTTYDNIQQYAMIRNGLTLAADHEIQIELVRSGSGATQDLGLYVGGTAPATDVRRDYISVYGRNDGQLFTRGFDGTTEYGHIGWISPAYTKLFIARTAVNAFEAGYYDAAGRHVMVTRTPTTANAATFVGIYSDVRGVGVLGNLDNLQMWSPLWSAHTPSPTSGNLAAGTPLGDGTVNVTLDWQAGLDPFNEAQVNGAITKHYVFMSDLPTDPNLYYLGTVAQSQPDTNPATSFGTVTGLSEVTAYRWAVVEALTGYDQQTFTAGVSTLDEVDPNNLIGPTWTFTTAVGVDRRLVGEYLFENNFNDNTAQGNNGSAAEPNAPTFSNVDALSGSGSYAVFDGGDFVNFGTAAYPKAGTFIYGVGAGLEEGTITCWVKATKAGGLLTNYNDGQTTGFALSLAANGTQIDTRMNARGESGDVGTVQGRPGKTDFHFVTDGQWHMIAATWKWGDTMRVYVDGGQVASVTAGTPTEFADWQYGVVLGASRNATNRNILQDFYRGALDTLRIYNYIRTPEQIANEYYTTSGNKACTDPSFTGSAFNFDNSGQSYCQVDIADFVVFAENWLLNGLTTGEQM
ncbi:MAG: LamG domain-containing protein [Planctomycetaceae bacterium]|nr:LamG domain-containing protein [Planctomycetaceae bacterium]